MKLIWELELKGTMCANATWQAVMVSIWIWSLRSQIPESFSCFQILVWLPQSIQATHEHTRIVKGWGWQYIQYLSYYQQIPQKEQIQQWTHPVNKYFLCSQGLIRLVPLSHTIVVQIYSKHINEPQLCTGWLVPSSQWTWALWIIFNQWQMHHSADKTGNCVSVY